VTGIEPALSAWESVPSGLLCGLTCGGECPRLTGRDRASPWLMARQWPGHPRLACAEHARRELCLASTAVGRDIEGVDRLHPRGLFSEGSALARSGNGAQSWSTQGVRRHQATHVGLELEGLIGTSVRRAGKGPKIQPTLTTFLLNPAIRLEWRLGRCAQLAVRRC
jgi:hypothetical protein